MVGWLNDGAAVLSTRYYPADVPTLRTANLDAVVYPLNIRSPAMARDTLYAIGEALIDMIPSRSGCAFADVLTFAPRMGL